MPVHILPHSVHLTVQNFLGKMSDSVRAVKSAQRAGLSLNNLLMAFNNV